MTDHVQRPFRFGVTLLDPGSRRDVVERCRRAESLGYDVIGMADHLGLPPVFPTLLLAAEVTERVRLTSFVVNTAFWNPVLLAREAAGTDRLTDGRLELGLGAGYMKHEFDAAGVRWGTGGERLGHLRDTVGALRGMFEDESYQPAPAQRGGPPVAIAGQGDRLLRFAAQHADIIGYTGGAPKSRGEYPVQAAADTIAERTAFIRDAAAGRDVELNVIVPHIEVTGDRRAATHAASEHFGLTPDELLDVPTVLFGTPEQLAEQLREHRARYGFSYITVLEGDMDDFAPVIELLR